MFSLQRKLSTTQIAAPTATASSPRSSPLPPTPTPTPGGTRATFAINPLTVFTAPPTSESYKEGSPTTHSGSNNEKSRGKQHSSQASSGSHQHAESAATSPQSTTLKSDHPVRSSSLHADADPSAARLSLGMLKSIRSLHVDSQQRTRAIARDFSLPPIPMSSLLHENCSSLKDQFLKIKERFSAPSPVAAKPSEPPPALSSPSSAPGANGATIDLSLALSTEASEDEWEQKRNGEQLSRENCNGSSSDLGGSTTLLVDTSDGTPKSQNTAKIATKQYSGESKWPHLQVERWYVEDNFFKGSVTCWTMDKGAEIVGRIAAVVSIAEASSQRRINPDISLQWIGRQLWAITISLPLTRSGELKDEHVELARRIDEAIAAEESKLSTALASPSPPDLRHHHSPLSRAEHESDNQIPTVVLREPDVANSVDQGGIGAARAAAHAASSDEEEECGGGTDDLLATAIATDLHGSSRDHLTITPAQASTPAHTQAGASAAQYRDISASTAAVEETDVDVDDASSHRGQSTNEEGDVVASLPLSWSMLSNTSISESGGGSISSNDPRDDDPRSPPEKTGWLKKKTGLNSWQQRYFELKGNRLYYFANETDGVPRGAIVLDHAHVLRGKGEQCMSFNITTSNSSHNLQILKFSARMASQVHLRKSCVLRVLHESEENVAAWVTALNRASFYCNLQVGSASMESHSPASPPGLKRKKMPFYRLRASSSSASSADDENKVTGGGGGGSLGSGTIECASYHHFGSVKYLQDTNPLLWEIHPHDQVAIRKKATLARTRTDYLTILSKYSGTFRQIFLPRPRPISLEQTLRDILPELFLINNILYGGGDENNGLENIFEVLDSYIKRFASAQEERVRAVSTLLQACARTISGGDSYFVIHSLLGNPFMIIRPAEARGHPIEIEVSAANPSQFLITVFSAFSFHHIDDVEKYGDSGDTSGGTSMTPEPLLRVKTHHIQEFDFSSGKSSRWLQIRADGMKDGSNTDSSFRQTWSKSEGCDTSFGALLDPLS